MRAYTAGRVRAHFDRDKDGRWVVYVEDAPTIPENCGCGTVRKRYHLPVPADAGEEAAEKAFMTLMTRVLRWRR